MGLRETLEAATRDYESSDLEGRFAFDHTNEWLADHTHELAALVLDMGEALRNRSLIDYEDGKWRSASIPEPTAAALLARLDQLGKEQT